MAFASPPPPSTSISGVDYGFPLFHPHTRFAHAHAANANYASSHLPATSPVLRSAARRPATAAHGIAEKTSILPLQDKGIQVVDQSITQQIRGWIDEIKGMFQSMTLGEVSVSAYDTAWVAMVPSLNGSNGPEFPKCLDWIIENQLSDGSWGDEEIFIAYDRVCNTVACLVALKTWNIGSHNIQKGVEFIHKNINKITKEADDHMPIAFEIVFPTMLDDAKTLGIQLPYDSPVVENIRKEGKRKLDRIPMDLLHTRPTTLLHSLEGLHKLVDWEKILKLQTKNGSFLFSTASTACALKYTGDKKCLEYLNSVLRKFHNAGLCNKPHTHAYKHIAPI